MTIEQGNCLELMERIPDGSVDMILCDPPYGTTGSKWDSVIPTEELFAQYRRIIKKTGSILIFGTEPFCTNVRHNNLDIYKYDLIWKKSTVTGFVNAKNMPLRDYENIMVFSFGAINHPNRTKNRMAYYPQGVVSCSETEKTNKNTTILHSPLTIYPETYTRKQKCFPRMVLNFNKHFNDTKFHVNSKPVELLEYLIRTYTQEGETVLDNCMGGGSTGVACVHAKRNFIGFELDEHYFEVAKKRIIDESNR